MRVLYQTIVLVFLFCSCATTTRHGITPQTKFEIACFDVLLTSGSKYDVFVINFVANGEVWVLWAQDSKGELGFNPIIQVDYGIEYYQPFKRRGGMLETSAKDFVIDLFIKYKEDEVDEIQRYW